MKRLSFFHWCGLYDKLLAWYDGGAQGFGRRLSRRGAKPARFRQYRPEIEQLEHRRLMSSGITEYSVSSSPGAITTGPDGNIWFTEGSGNIAKMNTSGTVLAEYATTHGEPTAITSGADGNIWFIDNGALIRGYIGKSTTSGTITEYAVPNSRGGDLYGITPGPDGNIWFTAETDGFVGVITPSGTITEYTPSGTPAPAGITAAADGNLWFADAGNSAIGKITTSGTITEYAEPSGFTGATDIAAGPDGKLWFNGTGNAGVGFMTLAGVGSGFSSPPAGNGITVGPDGNLWYADASAGELVQVTPSGTYLTLAPPTSGPSAVTAGPDKKVWFTEGTADLVAKVNSMPTATAPGIDPLPVGGPISLGPDNGPVNYAFGDTLISPENGNVEFTDLLDCGCSNPYDFLQTYGADYQSQTVNVEPIIQATLTTDPSGSVPSQIQAQLTWNNGTPQSWVTFSTTGHSAGDTYLLDTQVASAVTTTGYYPWKVEIKATVGSDTIDDTLSGYALVVANGSGDAVGQGWTLAGVDQLVSVTGGVLWVYGTGGSRFFASLGSGQFLSPPDDMGTLVQNGDSSYTYTAKDQVKYNFNSSGNETTIVDTHNLVVTYTYSGGNLSTVAEPDGDLVTFSYSGGLLSTIAAPGRTMTFLHDAGGNVTSITNPDGGLLTFTYDSVSRLTNLQWGQSNTTYSYSSANGLLTSVNQGLGDTLNVTPAVVQGLQTSPAQNASQDVGVLTDALSHTTSYTMDSQGRALQMKTADGATQSWQRDFAGQVTAATDARSNTTSFSYQYGAGLGDLTKVSYPDGTSQQYQYQATFHEPTVVTDQRSDTTSFTYDATTGDRLTEKNALSQVTTYTWSNGLMQTSTDPLNHTTSYTYNTNDRLQSVIDANNNRTTYGYDAAGNITTVTDPLNHVTTSVYDAERRLTSETNALGQTTTYMYNSQGLLTSQKDANSNLTTFSYDQRGLLVATTRGAGTASATTTTNLYDAAGNLTGTLDARNDLTQFLYDAANHQTVTIDALNHRTTSLLDLAGNVTGTLDANGNLTQFLYDSLNRQTVTIDALTHRTTSLLDLAGNVTGTLDADNNLTQFVFDGLNRQTVTIDALNHRTTSLFDAAGNMTGSLDANGNLTQYLYDPANRQTVTIDALSHRTTSLFDAAGNMTGSLDADGNLTQYVYDALNRETVTADALNHRTTSLFDAAGNMTGSLDANGNLTQYLYDTLNRETVTIDALNHRMTSLFDAAGNMTGSLDGNNNLTQYVYDALNRQTVTIDALTARTTSLFDAAGNLTGTLDALNHLTQYVYDALNRQTVTVDALTIRTTSLFDAAGNLTGTLDTRNNLTQYVFDADNRQSVTIDAASKRTTSLFDAAGNVTGVLNANNNLIQYVYDAVNRQTVTVDGAGNRTTSLFDPAGNLTGTLDANNHLTQFLYDAANRNTVTIDALSHRTTSVLDPAGNVTAVTDPLNHTTSYLFDALNRETVTIDALGNRTTSLFDAVGNLTSLTDAASNTTTFAFDADNRVTSQTDALGHTTTFAYNGVGLMTSTTDRDGRVMTFSYDADNRRTGATWYNSDKTTVNNVVTYMFDAVGNMTSAANYKGAYTLLYDAANRVTVVNEPFSLSLTFTYDGVGNRTLVQDSFGGTTTSVYDAANELTTRDFGGSGGAGSAYMGVTLTETPTHQLSTIARYSAPTGTGSLANTTFLYDALDRVTSIQHQNMSGTSLASFLYNYDAAGRLTVQTADNVNMTFTYDNTNQLTGDGTNTFTYDGEGNRNNPGYLTTAGNQLKTDATYTYTYDNEGNLAGKTTILTQDSWTYSYDNLNELTSAVEKSATGLVEQTVTFKYGPFQERLEKDVTTGSTVTTRFGYDGWKVNLDAFGNPATYVGNENWDVWVDLDGSNNLQTRYLRGDAVDQLFAREGSDSNVYWTLGDYQNSTRAVIDNSPNVKDYITYDGWGNATQTNSTYGGRYLWTGREWDTETALQYNRARYYDPHSGRWLQQDSTGFDAGDSNLYRYTTNEPTMFDDASGLQRVILHNPGVLDKTPPSDRNGYLERVQQEVISKATKMGLGPKTAKAFKDHSALAGVDIGPTLKNATRAVEAAFAKLNDTEKAALLTQLYGIGSGLKAWDVPQLAFTENSDFLTSREYGAGMFRMFATVNGETHFAGAVNYWWWGKLNRMLFDWELSQGDRAKAINARLELLQKNGCSEIITRGNGTQFAWSKDGTAVELPLVRPTNVSLERAITFVILYRTWNTEFGTRSDPAMGERVAWTKGGWTGDLSYASPYELNAIISPAPRHVKLEKGLTFTAGTLNGAPIINTRVKP